MPKHVPCLIFSSVLKQIGRHCSVFTFGFGSEHDADMLKAIATAGNGMYYFVNDADTIPESFCDCLGGLLSVAAQNLKLRITAAGDCALEKPLTAFKVTTVQEYKVYDVAIPDIYRYYSFLGYLFVHQPCCLQ